MLYLKTLVEDVNSLLNIACNQPPPTKLKQRVDYLHTTEFYCILNIKLKVNRPQKTESYREKNLKTYFIFLESRKPHSSAAPGTQFSPH